MTPNNNITGFCITDYILSIDQGTTSSRAILFNRDGRSEHSAQEEFSQHFPNDGWVEHDPDDIWRTVESNCKKVIPAVDNSTDTIKAIDMGSQTGISIYRAIVWQDRRTSEYCQQLKSNNIETLISEKTGLLIDPYFSATKIRWILDNVAGSQARAENGELAFGTLDSYILWKLTNGKEHRTDATNASRTMLFNIHRQEWDEELLTTFNIPRLLLPEVMDSSDNFGVSDKNILGVELPILGMAGDQQAALFGQTCFREGMAKSTYGTGCFMIVNTGNTALKSSNRLLTTVACRLNGKVTYALEGSIFIAGATIQWLRDGLKMIDAASEAEPLAQQTPVDHGVYLVPAFTGLGAPYWDPNARGAIFGLTRDTGIKEIVTAGLQSVCYQTKDLQRAMESDGVRPIALRVDGGMVANNWLMQFLADVLGATVDRPEITETTALGAAYLAGLKAGVYNSLEDLESMWLHEKRFEPEFDKSTRDRLYEGWLNAVRRVQSE